MRSAYQETSTGAGTGPSHPLDVSPVTLLYLTSSLFRFFNSVLLSDSPRLVQLVLGLRGGGRRGGRAVPAHLPPRAPQRTGPHRLRSPVTIFSCTRQLRLPRNVQPLYPPLACAGTADTGARARGRAQLTTTSRTRGCGPWTSIYPTKQRYCLQVRSGSD